MNEIIYNFMQVINYHVAKLSFQGTHTRTDTQERKTTRKDIWCPSRAMVFLFYAYMFVLVCKPLRHIFTGFIKVPEIFKGGP